MQNYPCVSVIIPTFNPKDYFKKAIESVISQTYQNFEIIVIDDGSITKSAENVCRAYGDRIHYVRQINRGHSAARNVGINLSRGEFIAFLDDDDIWLPTKLEKQLNFYRELILNNRNPGLVYTGHEYISEEAIKLCTILYKSSGYQYKKLVFVDFIGTPSSVMVKRNIFDSVGYFNESIISSSDYEMWLRIAKKYEVNSLNEILIQYRNRANSISKNPATVNKDNFNIKDYLLLDDDLIENSDVLRHKIIRRFNREAAMRWKNAAYEHLFYKPKADSKTFREFIQRGRVYDKSLFGQKVALYYFLSTFSPWLCRNINSLKNRNKFQDMIMSVEDIIFD